MTNMANDRYQPSPGNAIAVGEVSVHGFRESSRGVFFGTSALLFLGSTALTIARCGSMSAMEKMPMPGGWTMSMTWMRMSGQTWIDAAASFLGMWVVMMVAMMLPSLLPTLRRYRQAVSSMGESRLGRLTTLAGLGYFFVWIMLGLAVFPAGVVLASLEMNYSILARAVPTAVGTVVLFAGVLQLSPWKAHYLASCREAMRGNCTLSDDAGAAWRQGLHLGLHCSLSCANLTAILLALGIMDLRTMTVVTAAITLERLAPAGERAVQTIGVIVIVTGLVLMVNAISFCAR